MRRNPYELTLGALSKTRCNLDGNYMADSVIFRGNRATAICPYCGKRKPFTFSRIPNRINPHNK